MKQLNPEGAVKGFFRFPAHQLTSHKREKWPYSFPPERKNITLRIVKLCRMFFVESLYVLAEVSVKERKQVLVIFHGLLLSDLQQVISVSAFSKGLGDLYELLARNKTHVVSYFFDAPDL